MAGILQEENSSTRRLRLIPFLLPFATCFLTVLKDPLGVSLSLTTVPLTWLNMGGCSPESVSTPSQQLLKWFQAEQARSRTPATRTTACAMRNTAVDPL